EAFFGGADLDVFQDGLDAAADAAVLDLELGEHVEGAGGRLELGVGLLELVELGDFPAAEGDVAGDVEALGEEVGGDEAAEVAALAEHGAEAGGGGAAAGELGAGGDVLDGELEAAEVDLGVLGAVGVAEGEGAAPHLEALDARGDE